MSLKTKEEWLRYYREWEKSGQSQKAYCQEQKINYATFQTKIYRLRKTGVIARAEGVEIKKDRIKPVPGFQKIEIAEDEKKYKNQSYCEIKFNKRHKIIISSEESLVELGRILECLGKA